MVRVRRPPRWAELLPAALAVLAAKALAVYVLFAPLTSLPDGTPASALEAGNPFLVAVAGLVLVGGLVGGAAAATGRDRLLWAGVIALVVLGALPFALGPQVWVVALPLLVSAVLARAGADNPGLVAVAAVATLILGGLLWLTALTGPPVALILAPVLFLGTAFAVVAALDGGDRGRRHRGLAALVVVALVLGAAVPTLGAFGPSEPRIGSFSPGHAACLDADAPTTVGPVTLHSSLFGARTLEIVAAVGVNDTGHALADPTLERTAARNYTLALSSREANGGADCEASIPYSLSVILPQSVTETTVTVTHDGDQAIQVHVDGDEFEVRATPRSS